MAYRLSRSMWFRVIFTLVVLIGAAALISAPKSPYKETEKAAFADEKDVNYVRPGLVIKILSAEIATDGTMKARVRFTDPAGVPLDRAGIESPGVIGSSAIAAVIPKGATQYRSYTTRVQTSPITGKSATQAGADAGGVWALASAGEYVYTFNTKAPTG